MKSITLKLDDKIFEETEAMVSSTTKDRNRYINEALEHYNKFNKRTILTEKLRKEVAIVSTDSLEMVQLLDQLPDGIEKI